MTMTAEGPGPIPMAVEFASDSGGGEWGSSDGRGGRRVRREREKPCVWGGKARRSPVGCMITF